MDAFGSDSAFTEVCAVFLLLRLGVDSGPLILFLSGLISESLSH